MLTKSALARCISIAFGGTAIALAPALAAHAQEQQLEKVEITGSAIKRVQAEGPAPVEIYTRKDVERTGATSVNELLRSIPSIDIFDQGELASNSPAGSGTANIAMRGLSSSNVLVLLNGRRLPVNALYDSSGAGAAFDVNTIPVSAIERVEILKDGGSAIYGADAVAGVINIITKKDYQGIEARASYGISSRSDAAEKNAGLTLGFGDLNSDRFNVLVGIDYFKRDALLRKDRDISKSVDFRRYGSRDGRSSFSPYGNILDPVTGGFVGETYRPCPPENLNGVCRYDFNASVLSAYNGADRISALTVGTFQVTPDIRAFAEVMYAHTKDHFEAQPVPDYFLVPIVDPAHSIYDVTDNGEGTGTPIGMMYIAGRFMQGGPRITDRTSRLLNTVLGAEGRSFGLDWKTSISRGESRVTNKDKNYYDVNLWNNAIAAGDLDPTVSTNDPALVENLKVRPVREGKSVIETANVQVSGELTQLPAGPLGFAVGATAIHESLTDTPDPLTQAGEVVGSIQQSAVDASRTSRAVFGELSIPILKSLESQIAVRYDDYPGYSQTSPKLALRFQPMDSIMFRASYTESFRAPVLKQLYGATEEGAITITNPDQCAALGVACDVNAYQVNGSNSSLKPEKGKTYNVGVVFELAQNTGISIDLWRITKTDDISTPSISSAISQGLWTRSGARYYIFTNLQNIAERETAGVDLDGRVRVPGTALGTLTFRNLFTYYTTQKSRANATSDWAEYNGTYALPRWRNHFIAGFDKGPWSGQMAVRAVGGFWDSDLPLPDAAGGHWVSTYEETDVMAQYSGFKDWTITGGIKNVFDRMPPFSVTNATDNTYTQMGFAELYTNRGRFFYVGASYKFR